MKVKTLIRCKDCGLPIDICTCKEEAEYEKLRQEEIRSTLAKYCPISERMTCEICGRLCYGLMDFASHVAQVHNISAIAYWDKYGHEGNKSNEYINPSKRFQE